MAAVEVELYATQVSFSTGGSPSRLPRLDRERGLRWALREHVKERVRGADAHVGGRIQRDVLKTGFPEYRPSRHELTLEPVAG